MDDRNVLFAVIMLLLLNPPFFFFRRIVVLCFFMPSGISGKQQRRLPIDAAFLLVIRSIFILII
jgi:hypothetical protein